jgi:aryl-alcohol dehydrogenase-like predicted oxidoreductase
MTARRSPSSIPLIGTTKVDRYRQAAAAVDLELTTDQLARLHVSDVPQPPFAPSASA